MDQQNPSSRKTKRHESKKKKAAAFLALLDHKMADPVCKEKTSPGSGNEPLSDDILLEMRKIVRERKKQAMQKPKVYLTLEAMIQFRPIPDEPVKEEDIPPLYVMDLQQVLLYGLQGNSASYKPRWCKLLRVGKVSSVVLLMLEGISYNDYESNKTSFPLISQTFASHVEMVCPRQYMQTIDGELYSVPLSVSQLKKANVRVPKHIRDSVVAKIGQPVGTTGKDKLSRTCLLLSTYQMMLEGYPLPVHTNIGRYRDFVFTKDVYAEVTANSPMFAVDCEMCLTSIKKNELTRVSVISESGEVIYDTLVKPKNRIINYLTRFSGITKAMLDPVTTTIEDVQGVIRNILPSDAILCGQSLNGDLIALKMFHPYVVDTSVIFNMSGSRGVKAGLRKLSQFFLGRSIQDSKDGHSPIEDAAATLELVKLKLSKGLEFGDATLSGLYFPDIRTYFMPGESGSTGVVQNVEQDAKEDTHTASKNSSSVSSLALNTSKVTVGHTETQPSVVDNKSSVSIQGDCIDGISHSTDQKDSSDSSSSGDEGDHRRETDTDLGTSCPKKRKLDEPSKTKSNPSLGGKEDSDSPMSGDCKPQAGSIIKCKDFSFESTTELVQQQKQCLFTQENSVHISHSFFRLVYEAGRSGCMIDREDIVSKYTTEPVETIVANTDREVLRSAKEKVQSKEFVWAHFSDYSDEMELATQERKEKLMRKVDKRVHRVMKHVKPNSLVLLVMTGRDSDDLPQNIATFITTT